MTDDEAKALGLRAVACSGPWWRIHGALLRSGIEGKRTTVRMGVRSVIMTVTGEDGSPLGQDWLDAAWPDFRDPATLGCLLALVREAWSDPLMTIGVRDVQTSATTRTVFPMWNMNAGPGRTREQPMGPMHRMTMAQHRTEAEALVAALEAAR